MVDPRLSKMARVLVKYSLALKQGDYFLINASCLSAPLVLEVYREALKAGANPEVMLWAEGTEEILLKSGSEEQLKFVSPVRLRAIESANALLTIDGRSNTRALSNVDPNRMRIRSQGTAEINRIFMERMGRGELRWCGTLYPTEALAQEASMSLSEYEDFVFRACFVDKDDPVGEWWNVHSAQERLISYLNGKQEIRVYTEGTDLSPPCRHGRHHEG